MAIIGTLIAFVIGQIILVFVINPIKEQRNIISQISETFILYGNKLYRQDNQTIEDQMPVHDSFRLLASKLEAASINILWYGLWASCKIVKPMNVITDVRGRLIRISNLCFETIKELNQHGERGYQNDDVDKIKELLDIKV